MISREHRFHGHNSLRGVYNRGQTVRGPLCSLKITPPKNPDAYRAAVVVSKKVHKSAVVRNRIRRRLYEIIRVSPLAAQPHDIVLSVFSDQLADMPAKDVQKMLLTLMQQAGLGVRKTKKPE
jgi:ribonuclease P protein component